VYAWGKNDSGQLGDGSYTSTNVKINPQLDLYANTNLVTLSRCFDANDFGSIGTKNDGVLIGCGQFGPDGPNWGIVANSQIKYFSGFFATLAYGTGSIFAFDPKGNLWNVYDETIVFPNTSFIDDAGNQQGNKAQQVEAAGRDGFIISDVYKRIWTAYGSEGDEFGNNKNTVTLVPNISCSSLSESIFGGCSIFNNKPFYGVIGKTGGDTTAGLYMWGSNDSGQLGLGDTTDRSTPTKVNLDEMIFPLQGSGGYGFVYLKALNTSNTNGIPSGVNLFVWGKNDSYQLGLGLDSNITDPIVKTPKYIDRSYISGQLNKPTLLPKKLGYTYGAFVSDSNIYFAGFNRNGQANDGATTGYFTKFAGIAYPPKDKRYFSVACGLDHMIGINENRNYITPSPTQTASNTPSTSKSSTPTPTTTKTASGTPPVTPTPSTTKTASGTPPVTPTPTTTNTRTASQTPTPTVSITSSPSLTPSISPTQDSNILAWGDNRDGQLGDGTYINKIYKIHPIPDTYAYAEASFNSIIRSTFCGDGGNSGFYIRRKGDSVMLMSGSYTIDGGFQVMTNPFGDSRVTSLYAIDLTTTYLNSEIILYIDKNENLYNYTRLDGQAQVNQSKIPIMSNCLYVIGAGSNNFIALGDYGLVYTGNVYDGSNNKKADTVSVVDLGGTIGTSYNALYGDRIAGGTNASGEPFYGLITGNSLYMWGCNESGQLGLGDTTSRTTPTKVTFPTGYNILKVVCGHSFTYVCASGPSPSTARVIFTFGNNSYGQLGLGDTTNRLTPTIAFNAPFDINFKFPKKLGLTFGAFLSGRNNSSTNSVLLFAGKNTVGEADSNLIINNVYNTFTHISSPSEKIMDIACGPKSIVAINTNPMYFTPTPTPSLTPPNMALMTQTFDLGNGSVFIDGTYNYRTASFSIPTDVNTVSALLVGPGGDSGTYHTDTASFTYRDLYGSAGGGGATIFIEGLKVNPGKTYTFETKFHRTINRFNTKFSTIHTLYLNRLVDQNNNTLIDIGGGSRGYDNRDLYEDLSYLGFNYPERTRYGAGGFYSYIAPSVTYSSFLSGYGGYGGYGAKEFKGSWYTSTGATENKNITKAEYGKTPIHTRISQYKSFTLGSSGMFIPQTNKTYGGGGGGMYLVSRDRSGRTTDVMDSPGAGGGGGVFGGFTGGGGQMGNGKVGTGGGASGGDRGLYPLYGHKGLMQIWYYTKQYTRTYQQYDDTLTYTINLPALSPTPTKP
jgi:alpha-tubulin suppressor-like RCC1 family protein